MFTFRVQFTLDASEKESCHAKAGKMEDIKEREQGCILIPVPRALPEARDWGSICSM
jgi:hypothetical protein